MNYIERLMESQKEIFQNIVTLPVFTDEDPNQVVNITAGQLKPNDPIWDYVTQYRAECHPQSCNDERYVIDDTLIAGMDLKSFIINFPKVQYVVGQMLDFIYKEEMVITDLKKNLKENESKTIQQALHQKDMTGVTNSIKIYNATKEALLYGRAGVFRQVNGELTIYNHDEFTVVMGMKVGSPSLKSEVLGYIVYEKSVTSRDAVIDLANLGDFGSGISDDYNNDWLFRAIKRDNKITNYDDKMLYIPVNLKRFINLRYDTEVQNPLSRLYYSRLEVENSTYFRQAMNRKFLEKGLGRLIIQLKDETTQAGNNDNSLDALFNTNKKAKESWISRVQEFSLAFSNTLRNLRDDDFVVSPSNIDNIERLENTNEPNLFLKLLDSDDTILPSVYGIPPSLLGLGTLSDRNISIASVNATAEDTTVREVRETFMNQLALLFDVGDDEILTTEKLVDKATEQDIAKVTAEVAKLMSEVGMVDEAKEYIRNNIIQ